MTASRRLILTSLMGIVPPKSSSSSCNIESPSTHSKNNNNKKSRKTIDNSNNRSLKKQVRFSTSSSSSSSSSVRVQDIKVEYFEPSYELTEEMCNELWWSLEEREENGMKRKTLAHEFRSKDGNKTIDETYESLYKNCSTMSLTQVLRSRQAKQVLLEVASSSDGLRGLENKISKTVSRHRKQHIHTMLSIVGDSSSGVGGVSEELLSENSKQSSRASEVLARVIALLDAREASLD